MIPIGQHYLQHIKNLALNSCKASLPQRRGDLVKNDPSMDARMLTVCGEFISGKQGNLYLEHEYTVSVYIQPDRYGIVQRWLVFDEHATQESMQGPISHT